MVNEYCIVKIKTQEEWDSLLEYLKNIGNWHRKDYERVFRSNYETEDIGIEIINDIIDGYSNYNWFANNSDYNLHNFMTVQSFIKQKIHENMVEYIIKIDSLEDWKFVLDYFDPGSYSLDDYKTHIENVESVAIRVKNNIIKGHSRLNYYTTTGSFKNHEFKNINYFKKSQITEIW